MTTNIFNTTIQLSPSIQLAQIVAQDQNRLYTLMSRIYPAAYAHLWKDGGVQYMQQLYQSALFQQELNDPNALFYFVCHEEQPVGILRLLQNLTMEEYYGEQSTKLQRIYLAPEVQGQGIGKRLLQWCSDQFLRQQGDQLWLEVMNTEKKAILFYQKMGFTVVRHFEFDAELMYSHLRGMYAMQKTYSS